MSHNSSQVTPELNRVMQEKWCDWITKAAIAVSDCRYPGYRFEVKTSSTTKAVYLHASYEELDTTTQNIETQFTRRWLLSPEMSKSEIVQTVLKCVMTSMEHRTREWFLYKNRAIFMPHHDVDQLYEICLQRDERRPLETK